MVAGGRVVRGWVTGGRVAGGWVAGGWVAGGWVVVTAAVVVGSASELGEIGTDDDEVVVVVVDAAVVEGAVVDASEVAGEPVTEMRSTVGSAESSWNAAITTRLATRTANNAPMKPLFLGTYPANRSVTSNPPVGQSGNFSRPNGGIMENCSIKGDQRTTVSPMSDNYDQANGLRVSEHMFIPANELQWRFGPSGGPGGQHANTSNTRAELAFEIGPSAALDDRQRALLTDRYGPRIRVAADDHRSQHRNRELALERLTERIRDGLVIQRSRRATKPSRGSKERRLRAKKERSGTKAQRRRPTID